MIFDIISDMHMKLPSSRLYGDDKIHKAPVPIVIPASTYHFSSSSSLFFFFSFKFSVASSFIYYLFDIEKVSAGYEKSRE